MWKFLVKEKFNKKVQFEIFGTNGNGKLVQKVMSNKYTDEDIYIIFIDVPFNNEKTLGIYRDLMELTEDIKNAIKNDRLLDFTKEFMEKYGKGKPTTLVK